MAKIPITLEAGTADGKLAMASAIYNETTGKFVGSDIADMNTDIASRATKTELAKSAADAKELADATYATQTSLANEVKKLTGIDDSNFMGIFNTLDLAKAAFTKVGWALVGTDLAVLTAYRVDSKEDATQIGEKTYDFTDYSDLKAEVAEIETSLKTKAEKTDVYALQSKTSEISKETTEDTDDIISITKDSGTKVVGVSDDGVVVTGSLKVGTKEVLTEHQDISGKADKSYVDTQDALKQDKLTAGKNITIADDGTISASGSIPEISEEETGEDDQSIVIAKVDGTEVVKVTESGVTVNGVDFANKQDKLTAGENITIDDDGTISASGSIPGISEEETEEEDEAVNIKKADGSDVVIVNNDGIKASAYYDMDGNPIANQSQITGKTMVVLGDSIMMLMNSNTRGSNTITFKGSDGNTYDPSSLTLRYGTAYVTSSLGGGGSVLETSIECTPENTNQSALDALNWESLKTNLGVSKLYNLGLGGATLNDRGLCTSYPWNDEPAITYGATVGDGDKYTTCLPNEVRWLLRRVGEGTIDTPDFILIWLGTNGAGGSFENYDTVMATDFDTLDSDEGYTLRRTQCGGLRWSLEKLYRAFPYATIIFATPVQANPASTRTYENLTITANGIKKVAARYACQVSDALNEIGVVDFYERPSSTPYLGSDNKWYALSSLTLIGSTYYVTSTLVDGEVVETSVSAELKEARFLTDGLHPNNAGKVVWTNYITSQIKAKYYNKK